MNIFKSPNILYVLALIVITLVWLVIVTPLSVSNHNSMSFLNDKRDELRALKELGGQIKALEKSLTNINPTGVKTSNESILKQVERLAKETKIFPFISRISPIQINHDGTQTKGLTIEINRSNMASLTPFLHALAHKSMLVINSIDLRRIQNESGTITVQLTLFEAS